MHLTPETFMDEYARRTNSHQFAQLAELIAPDAVFWFNDGSYAGLPAIQKAFEDTWKVLHNDHYDILQVQWIAIDQSSAACIYHFHWQTQIDGALREGGGRGTTVLRKNGSRWQVAHEHLSPYPRQDLLP